MNGGHAPTFPEWSGSGSRNGARPEADLGMRKEKGGEEKEGDWEDIDSDWSDEIESYPEDAEWDIDSDYAFDRIRDEIDGIEEYRGKKDILQKIEID